MTTPTSEQQALPGNPYVADAQDDPRNPNGTTANAILALAYEQRTANLLAAGSRRAADLAGARLGLADPPPKPPQLETVETTADLADLPNGSAICDRQGDVGVILNGNVWYPETAPMPYARVARLSLPAAVVHRGA